ncbi:hypothetical protein ACH5RR_023025 [Cinchona calisaya]|uniref:Uncharacterized protein n=1 Tax=Cinchona calisaya TaxID=153742 RepID=A0ABD2ZEF5_9GENT
MNRAYENVSGKVSQRRFAQHFKRFTPIWRYRWAQKLFVLSQTKINGSSFNIHFVSPTGTGATTPSTTDTLSHVTQVHTSSTSITIIANPESITTFALNLALAGEAKEHAESIEIFQRDKEIT